jgi:hypothetical protein
VKIDINTRTHIIYYILNKMITCNLMGGLGNQLFQIMATIAYAIQHNVDFGFEYSEMLGERKTYWDTFLLPLKKHTRRQSIRTNYKYLEPEFTYRQIPKDMTDLCLCGYFQSYKYFAHVEEEAFTWFDLRRQQELERSELQHEGRTISIHFRLGDYKHKQEYHPVLPVDYYRSALELVGYTPNEDIVYVFCEAEDIDYVERAVRELYVNIDRTVYVDSSIPDWRQMLMMSACNVNIIANSTFSWWGAYLNNTPGKVVIRPKMWFGRRIQHDICDMFPGDWIEN